MSKRPNFLFLITDQHRPDHTGFGGNEIVQTPHLDAIAARGVVFDRAFVANPICMPNRSTIMTGRMPSVHGTRYNGVPLNWRVNTFVRVLRAHGYRTTHIGKSHLQNMGVRHASLDELVDWSAPAEAVTTDLPDGWDELESVQRYRTLEPVPLPDDFYGFERVNFTNMHGDRCGGHYYQWLLQQGVDPTRLQGFDYALTSYKGWGQVYQTALPVELYPTSYVTKCAVEEISAAAADGRPFFIYCSWPDPHHPFTPPGEYWDRYAPRDIELPATFDDPHDNAMPHYRKMLAQRGTPMGRGVDGWAPTADQYRHAAAAEYGMISLIDDGVGRILAALEQNGVVDETIIIFTSDHGDMFGDHGVMLKHAMHYEGCTRVPLVINRPGQVPARTHSLAGSLDLAQTILDLADLPAYHGMQGTSLVPLLQNPHAVIRHRLLIEEDEKSDPIDAGHPLRMRTLVTPQARFTLYQGHPHGELFDLTIDPLEQHNLFGTAKGAALQAEMTRALADEMMQVMNETPRPTAMA